FPAPLFVHIFVMKRNSRTSEMMLSKEKARLKNRPRHASWLRIYAIKLNPGIYVITGGAIKLTRTMQEREHTLKELEKMEKIRQYLVANKVVDDDSFLILLRRTDYENRPTCPCLSRLVGNVSGRTNRFFARTFVSHAVKMARESGMAQSQP
ncbi:MAG: hypothetical protein ACI4TU_03465, partial [Candidatus Cryptobacteroides sp.]